MEVKQKVVELQLDDILPNRFQPRIKFNEESINELSSSIKEHGVIQPIVVRPVGDKYEIIAGERRYKASTLSGLKSIPAIITDLNDKDSAEVALIENVQRKDLTPIEEAISYKKILDMGYIKQENLAEKLGKKQSTVANKLRLLNLSEDVQEALLNEKISERHARSILKLKSEDQQLEILNKIINERLTVRKTDEVINKMINEEKEENKYNGIDIIDFDESPEETNVTTFEPSNSNHSDIPTVPIINDIAPQQPGSEIDFLNFDDSSDAPLISDDNNSMEENSINNEVPVMFPSQESILEEDDNEPIIKPNKFFNILGETSEKPELESIETNKSENSGTADFDFDSLFITEDNDKSSEISNEIKYEENGKNSFVAGDIKTVINTLRDSADTIEKYGFKVDLDEFDLEDTYQVIFKIQKKQ